MSLPCFFLKLVDHLTLQFRLLRLNLAFILQLVLHNLDQSAGLCLPLAHLFLQLFGLNFHILIPPCHSHLRSPVLVLLLLVVEQRYVLFLFEEAFQFLLPVNH